MRIIALLIISGLAASLSFSYAQQDSIKKEGFQFEVIKTNPATPVKDQYRSGTCWSFATVSFIESELLRLGAGEKDLSEMYFVNHAYREKAERYVRLHGSSNFGPGGQAHDVMNTIAKYGFAGESDYPGLLTGESKHLHGELDAVLKAYLDAVVQKKDGKLSKVWPDAFAGILDAYLGPVHDQANGKNAGALPAYAQAAGFNPADYIELTSFLHHPFYQKINLEIPDNWSQDLYYNLPLDELMDVMNHAIEKGYTICWDGDVSDKGFSHAKGVAILPEISGSSLEGTERERWEKLSEKEKNAELYSFSKPVKEKNITPEIRQEDFNNLKATDDHLMHITGIATDQLGTRYYITKNSWAADSNKSGGYLNMSEAYVRLNTIAVMVHKDAVPPLIRKKLGI
ncbi:Peptidase C1-like family protein [anaerobic digester metagenome]